MPGSPPELFRIPCSSFLPAFEESVRTLSAPVTYLRTWVDSCVATQPRATKKMKPKAKTRISREPRSVIQAGSVRPPRLFGWLLGRPEGLWEGLLRRDFGGALWDLRSIRTPRRDWVGEGGLEPPRPFGH